MAPHVMININKLTVRYGPLVAVNGITLEIPEGDIFGLVGPNGAGKTTTLKVLAGLLLPDAGDVTVDGFNVLTQRDAVRLRIGYMADFFGVYDYLTVHEYLAFFGGMYHLAGEELERRIAGILKTVNLEPKKNAFIQTLSRGMKQRLYFARTLVHQPRLLILDEPASGMDPRGRAEMVETLKAANRQGITIIISSHILDELQNLCTSVAIMETGRLAGIQSLTGGRGAPSRRRVLLKVAPADASRAQGVLEAHPGVFAVTVTADHFLLEIANDDQAESDLVRDLVRERIRLALPRADGADLRDIFLSMTKGELM